MIGVISDIHDQVEMLEKAIALFAEEKVSRVYLLGDICSPFTLSFFSRLECPVIGVFGNNDADIFKSLSSKPKNVEFFDRFHEETIAEKKVALLHGDPEGIAQAVFKSGRYDAVFRGHSHKAEVTRDEDRLLVNPGNLLGKIPGFESWTEASVAFYDPEKNDARIVRL